ncbi:FAD-dependent monooxygenase [Mycobacterium sp. Aquia_216]|uniref:FAD-dependent oxidoreductase n=1 Tax=Mycobacterium sp. Aquia_216 TaxID=2991729 RepID=UPI00227C89BE|nr:FAD-dependent monooxygenase [Mycobacterium sp. Aquia_216]WAJ46385.1 FAD-dependent monooxygenase [Mycobacterium sp. Aquia_216]
MSNTVASVFDRLVNAEPPGRKRLVFDTACVVGGSIAGLLAARVLSDFARHVVIIERDELGDRASRPGVPQGHQLHVALAAGRRWMDRWLPGFSEEALARGAVRITSEDQTLDGDLVARSSPHYEMLGATRPLLESAVRTKVLSLANISVQRAQARGLRYRDGAVAGIEFVGRSGAAVLEVDFVVDAMGRSSRLSRWVSDAGFDRPRLERLALPINYATAIFERSEASADSGGTSTLSIFSPGNTVDGVAIASAAEVENDQWMVCLIGCGDDRPGQTADDFRAKCAQLESVYATATAGRISRDVATYHQTESRRRHFTGLDNFPARLVCVGDAVASFNPVYGQGMSSAALQASCLSSYLSDAGGFDSVARDFFRLQRVVVDAAWDVSTAGDRARLDFLNGAAITEVTRHQRWSQDQIVRATLADSSIAELYSDVRYMLRHPSALAHPALLERAVAINSASSSAAS